MPNLINLMSIELHSVNQVFIPKAFTIGGGLTLRGNEQRIVTKRKNGNGVLQEIEVELGEGVLKDDVIYVGERWF